MARTSSSMSEGYFSEETLDDVMRSVIEAVRAHGVPIVPSKGPASELFGVLLHVANPRARLSRTETRGKLFSAIGEFCWHLAKSNDVGFITYYIQDYVRYADGDRIFGGYGPRLFNWDGADQFAEVIALLRRSGSSRKAVIQLFDRHDILQEHRDVPCTCTLQFALREGKLSLFTNMRSNDVYKGLPHDIFCFTMLQEIAARTLSVEIGTYKHAVGSLHLYEEDFERAGQFLAEGWQSTELPMPPMPSGDQWRDIGMLLEAERSIRTTGGFDERMLAEIAPYWADLIRLLQIFRFRRDRNRKGIEDVRSRMDASVYRIYIDKVLGGWSDQ